MMYIWIIYDGIYVRTLCMYVCNQEMYVRIYQYTFTLTQPATDDVV